MNDLVKAAASEVQEASQLITLVPEKYVAEVFAPFKKSLTKAIKEATGVTYDIQTKEGMNTAKQLRTSFKSIRTAAESTRKERKAPIIEIGKLLDARYKVLESEIAPHEDKYDGDIKAEEKRIEEEKARKEAEERARVEAIENRIANIRNVPVQNMARSSADIVDAISSWSNMVLNPADYDEYLEDAINAVNATLVELEKVRASAAKREADEAKAEADRLELARLREESEKREREAAELRAKEEERQRQITQAHEAQMQAMRDEMAQKQAEMDRQRAEMEQERAALEAMKNPPAAAFAQMNAMVEVAMPPVVDPDFEEVVKSIPSISRDEAGFLDLFEAAAAAPKRPSEEQIITTLAEAYNVSRETVIDWIACFDLASVAA